MGSHLLTQSHLLMRSRLLMRSHPVTGMIVELDQIIRKRTTASTMTEHNARILVLGPWMCRTRAALTCLHARVLCALSCQHSWSSHSKICADAGCLIQTRPFSW